MNGKNCRYLRTQEHASGPASYCEAAARDLRLSPAQLRLSGCTPERRRECFRNDVPAVCNKGDGDYREIGFPSLELAAGGWHGWHGPVLPGPLPVERFVAPAAPFTQKGRMPTSSVAAGGMVASSGPNE